MNIITVILLGLAGALGSLMLKQHGREFAVIVSISVCVIIIIAGADILSPTITFVKTLIEKTGSGVKYAECLLKCVGICCLASFAQDLCVDNNERSIASSVEFAARAAVAVTVMPILKELAETAFNMG